MAGNLIEPTLIRQLSNPTLLNLHQNESLAFGLGLLKSEDNKHFHGAFHPTSGGTLGMWYQLAIKNCKVWRLRK